MKLQCSMASFTGIIMDLVVGFGPDNPFILLLTISKLVGYTSFFHNLKMEPFPKLLGPSLGRFFISLFTFHRVTFHNLICIFYSESKKHIITIKYQFPTKD